MTCKPLPPRGAASAMLIALLAACVTSSRSGSALLKPSTYSFPYATDLECPSEVCVTGRWLACDSVELYTDPRDSRPATAWLQPGDRVEVVSATALTIVPGAVEVVRTVRQRLRDGSDRVYAVGDTVFVLAHEGEGWFDTVHRGERARTEIFWPWDRGSGWQISGRVLQELTEQVWLETTSAEGSSRWFRADAAGLVSPYGRVEPLQCGTGASAITRREGE